MATATPAPVATDTPKPTARVSLGPVAALKQLTIICRTDALDDTSPDLTGEKCLGIFRAVLPALGSLAGDVVRLEAGLVCPASSSSCTDNLIVGFKDGHLEGAKATSASADAPYIVGTLHAVAASVWPWGSAATFHSPAVKRPSLPIPASPELAKRTALPYCGLEVNDPASDARICFSNAVLTGHPAEIVTKTTAHLIGAPDGTDVAVIRFNGSGSIAEYDGSIPGKGSGTWYGGPNAMMITIGQDSFVQIVPIDTAFPA
jgi:hypothetical protein